MQRTSQNSGNLNATSLGVAMRTRRAPLSCSKTENKPAFWANQPAHNAPETLAILEDVASGRPEELDEVEEESPKHEALVSEELERILLLGLRDTLGDLPRLEDGNLPRLEGVAEGEEPSCCGVRSWRHLLLRSVVGSSITIPREVALDYAPLLCDCLGGMVASKKKEDGGSETSDGKRWRMEEMVWGSFLSDNRVDANLCDLQNIGSPEDSFSTRFSLSLALFSCPCFPIATNGCRSYLLSQGLARLTPTPTGEGEEDVSQSSSSSEPHRSGAGSAPSAV
ncbi:hypothetical protein Taro_004599 [Colocasia esculenta]|uniref:Uncharacterized protein n=1 Tax=Colocasia esculenta TaxID=4460 RepID=A0A843TKG7_COLES|nr:hypothetical protein [Colocasia esculenta]